MKTKSICKDTSRGIRYIVSWFALEIKLSEGWFERVRAEGHCWTSIKMSPHTECQNYANIPQSSSLRQTFTHRCNFQQVYWGKGRPAIYACSWLSDRTIIVFHISHFVFLYFCFMLCILYLSDIYAYRWLSDQTAQSCYFILWSPTLAFYALHFIFWRYMPAGGDFFLSCYQIALMCAKILCLFPNISTGFLVLSQHAYSFCPLT